MNTNDCDRNSYLDCGDNACSNGTFDPLQQ